MSTYVYITEQCQEDAHRHGRMSLVENLKASLESKQQLVGFEYCKPFLKKDLGNSFRLIAYHRSIDDDELIIFLRILSRSDRLYERFVNYSDSKDIVRQFVPYSDNDFYSIYQELRQSKPPSTTPQLDDEEQSWLYEVLRRKKVDNELLIFETEHWVKWVKKNCHFLTSYHSALEHALSKSILREAKKNTEWDVYWSEENKIGFVYLYRPDIHRLLLFTPFHDAQNEDRILEECAQKLGGLEEGQHDLSRIAVRSYPAFIALDREAWVAIQKDEESNLALSPEEAELLESMHRAGAHGAPGYPLFINGRAGSGKSTMLQYLAADYLDFALRQRTRSFPLYLTSSRELLERARTVVRGLLTTHHERLLEGTHDPSDVQKLLEQSFQVFHDFLYSLLPPDKRNALPAERYVDYAGFRRLWMKDFARRPEARRISPDLAWHVIRSYIKGIRSSPDDDFSPDEFKTMARRRRSVSEARFREIYDHVWNSWYRRLCEEEGYWDDQDLAVHVLESGATQGVHCAAIFCDEAQDFTSVELDIIFQLSLFTRRSLQPEELRRVPIVFAGDPLQTINPTGFRWDAVKETFQERFWSVLDPYRRSRPEFSYRELQFNYRSDPGVVGFCNLIQLVRAVLFDTGDIQPQESWWWLEKPVPPVWSDSNNPQTAVQIQRIPELVKLVNCEKGEESEYVRQDDILRNLREEEGVYRNVLSPARAKGLEFPVVVLYRFGETAPADFARLLDGEATFEDPEERLPYEYFLNRLYVAASRAKSQIIVVDSEEVLQKFWRFATDPDLIDRLIKRVDDAEVWKSAIAPLIPGDEKVWSGQPIDPQKQAESYKEQGQRDRDPYLLRQAAHAYRSMGKRTEADQCFASALEFEGKYREAGDRYCEAGYNNEAFECYWKGQAWDPLCNLAAKTPSLSGRLESRAADFMAHLSRPDTRFLNALIDASEDGEWTRRGAADRTWHSVLDKVAEQLAKALNDESIHWIGVHQTLHRLAEAGVPIRDIHRAGIAYAARDYAAAARLWEQAESTERRDYYRAKAYVTPFPDNLPWLASARDYAEILRQWREQRPEPPAINEMVDRVLNAVIDAALDEKDLALALRMLRERPDRDRVIRLIETALKLDERWTARAAIVEIDDRIRRAVVDEALRRNNLALALQILRERPDRDHVARLIKAALGSGNQQIARTTIIEMDDRVIRAIVDEALRRDDLPLALHVLRERPDRDFVARLIDIALKSNNYRMARSAITEIDDRIIYEVADEALKRNDLALASHILRERPERSLIVRIIKTALESGDHKTAKSVITEIDDRIFRAAVDEALASSDLALAWHMLRERPDRSRIARLIQTALESGDHKTAKSAIADVDDRSIRDVVDETIASNNFTLALRILEERPDRNRLARLIEASLESGNHETVTSAAVVAARLFVRDSEWTNAVKAAEEGDVSGLREQKEAGAQPRRSEEKTSGAEKGDSRDTQKHVIDPLRSPLKRSGGKADILYAVVEELAASEALLSANPKYKEMIAAFLRQHFIDNGEKHDIQADRFRIPPHLIGAAIERAGNLDDAIQYYESLEREALLDKTKKFAAERLIVNLNRLVGNIRSTSNTSPTALARNLGRIVPLLKSRGDEASVQQREEIKKIEERIKNLQNHYRLGNLKDLPEYPLRDDNHPLLHDTQQAAEDARVSNAPSKLDTGLSASGQTEWIREPFKVTLSRVHQRLRIEHTERFETVTINIISRQIRGDAAISSLPKESMSESTAWKIDDWNAVIIFVHTPPAKCIIRLDQKDFEIPVE